MHVRAIVGSVDDLLALLARVILTRNVVPVVLEGRCPQNLFLARLRHVYALLVRTEQHHLVVAADDRRMVLEVLAFEEGEHLRLGLGVFQVRLLVRWRL